MGKRVGLILGVAAVGALVAGLWHPLQRPSQYPLPTDREFAVWPVDTIVEAEGECAEGDDWRHSLEETAYRFADEVLDAEEIEVTDARSLNHDEGATSVTSKGDPLGTSVFGRQAFGCWYVTGVSAREDFSSGDPTFYAGAPPEQVLGFRMRMLTVPQESRVTGSLGSGLRSIPLDLSLEAGSPPPQVTIPADPELPGHYLYIGYGYPEADTVPPPPDPATGVEVPGFSAVQALLRQSLEEEINCARLWAGNDEPDRATLHHLWLAEVRGDGNRSHSEPVSIGHGDYLGRIDGVSIEFDFWRPDDRCAALARVTTRGDQTEEVRSVRLTESAFFLELDWGRATEAEITYGFGNDELDIVVNPVRNPLILSAYESRRPEPGFYFVTFYENGRVIAVEGGAVPPVPSLRQTTE